MIAFTSYFIGIPLPSKFQNEYEMVLRQVRNITPLLETVNFGTPHITIYYLTKFPILIPSRIVDILKPEVSSLRSSVVTVGKLGIFGGENPKTIFLDTKYPENLVTFRKTISEIFIKNSALDNAWPFSPHMTVAKVKNEIYKEEVISQQPKLKELLGSISWTFPITELALYGVDSTQLPEYQEKIVVIPI